MSFFCSLKGNKNIMWYVGFGKYIMPDSIQLCFPFVGPSLKTMVCAWYILCPVLVTVKDKPDECHGKCISISVLQIDFHPLSVALIFSEAKICLQYTNESLGDYKRILYISKATNCFFSLLILQLEHNMMTGKRWKWS